MFKNIEVDEEKITIDCGYNNLVVEYDDDTKTTNLIF